jgi:hypothetical protein
MPMTTGFHHVATVAAGLDRVVAFYQAIFDARITLEIAATEDHPRMVILDLGAGSTLGVTLPVLWGALSVAVVLWSSRAQATWRCFESEAGGHGRAWPAEVVR